MEIALRVDHHHTPAVAILALVAIAATVLVTQLVTQDTVNQVVVHRVPDVTRVVLVVYLAMAAIQAVTQVTDHPTIVVQVAILAIRVSLVFHLVNQGTIR